MTGRPVAFITGAANGIGAAVVTKLADDGYDLALLDLAHEGLSAVEHVASARGAGTIAIAGDARDADIIDDLMGRVERRFGRLDALVTCAGVNAYFDAATMTEDQWDEVFAVDLKAAWLACRASLPALVRSTQASIVTISSIHARITTPGMFPYAAAKAGLEGMTRSLAVDHGPQGVRANVVAPGWTRTRLVDEWLERQDNPAAAMARINALHPLGRIAEPSEIADVVAFLVSPASRAVTGSTFVVDCGISVRFG